MRNCERCFTIWILALWASGQACAGETIVAESRIVHVTVLADRAEITRQVTVNLPVGESIVVVDGLIHGLDERTLRAEAAQGARIQGISSDVVQRPVVPPVAKASLLEQQKTHQARIETIDSSVLGLRRQVDLCRSYRGRTLESIGLQASLPKEKLPQPEIDLPSWTQTLETLAQQELESLGKIRDLEVVRFHLLEEQKRVAAELDRHAKPQLEPVRRALIGVHAQQAAPVSMRLVYRVNGPSWRLRYDVRFDTAKKKLLMEGYGVVLQQTGEDWPDVELVLSTRFPASGLRAPKVPTLLLEGRERETLRQEIAGFAEKVSVGTVPDRQTPGTGADAAGENVPEGAQPAEAAPGEPAPLAGTPGAAAAAWKPRKGLEDFVALESSLTGQFFKVLQKSTVSSSDEAQQVPILKAEVPATLQLEAVPKYTAMVYRRVTARNDSGAPLLAGRSTLFLDGAMIGVTNTATVEPGADLILCFGAVDGLSVAQQRADAGRAPAEVVAPQGGRRVYCFQQSWKILNRTDREAQVRLLETVPVSEVKEIGVAIDAKATSAYRDLGHGILAFPAKVDAGQSMVVNLSYSVSMPETLKF